MLTHNWTCCLHARAASQSQTKGTRLSIDRLPLAPHRRAGSQTMGKSKWVGEHVLMWQWVRVVGETVKWVDTRGHACTCEGG